MPGFPEELGWKIRVFCVLSTLCGALLSPRDSKDAAIEDEEDAILTKEEGLIAARHMEAAGRIWLLVVKDQMPSLACLSRDAIRQDLGGNVVSVRSFWEAAAALYYETRFSVARWRVGGDTTKLAAKIVSDFGADPQDPDWPKTWLMLHGAELRSNARCWEAHKDVDATDVIQEALLFATGILLGDWMSSPPPTSTDRVPRSSEKPFSKAMKDAKHAYNRSSELAQKIQKFMVAADKWTHADLGRLLREYVPALEASTRAIDRVLEFGAYIPRVSYEAIVAMRERRQDATEMTQFAVDVLVRDSARRRRESRVQRAAEARASARSESTSGPAATRMPPSASIPAAQSAGYAIAAERGHSRKKKKTRPLVAAEPPLEHQFRNGPELITVLSGADRGNVQKAYRGLDELERLALNDEIIRRVTARSAPFAGDFPVKSWMALALGVTFHEKFLAHQVDEAKARVIALQGFCNWLGSARCRFSPVVTYNDKTVYKVSVGRDGYRVFTAGQPALHGVSTKEFSRAPFEILAVLGGDLAHDGDAYAELLAARHLVKIRGQG